MTTTINVDEARKALEQCVAVCDCSDEECQRDQAQIRLIFAALDRLEELEANLQGIHFPEAREALNRLIRNRVVSLQEASFLSTAINRAEEVPALSMERDAAIRQTRLPDGHAKRMTESVASVEAERDDLKAQLEKLQKLFADKCCWEACGDCAGCQRERADSVEAECDVLKARVEELEAANDSMVAGNNAAMRAAGAARVESPETVLSGRDGKTPVEVSAVYWAMYYFTRDGAPLPKEVAYDTMSVIDGFRSLVETLRAQLETALANQKVEGFTTSDNAYSQALDREFSLFSKLKTAKGLLRWCLEPTKGLSVQDVREFLGSKEGEE